MKKVEKNITLKEFKKLHSKRQSKTLTPFERYKIMCVLKSPIEVLILVHLYTKFLHFDMKEFHQRKFDIQVGTSNYSENTITNNLSSLERKGYFTQEFKQVKGKNYNRIHFNINIQKLNELLTTGDELKPENFSKLIETLRRQNEVVKSNPYNKPKAKTVEITDNTDDNPNATKTLKSIEEVNHNLSDNSIDKPKDDNNDSDDELIGVVFEDFEDDKPNDNKTDDEISNNEKIENDTTIIEPEILSNDDSNDDNDISISTNTIDSTPVIKPDTLSKEDKIINNNITKQQEIMNVNKTPNEISTEETEDFNKKTKLFMKYKDYEGIKPVLKDTMLSFDTINYLYSSDYVKGVDEKLDNHKATLDILYDIRIKQMENK